MFTMQTGKVLRLDSRGYGFIMPDSNPNGSRSGVFFHRSALNGNAFDALQEGDAVTYIEEASPKGPRAATVAVAPLRSV
jgi:cold shock CspA family protein